jgi:ubiquinone/menaquinone biosynthesis C-methylase UbiE
MSEVSRARDRDVGAFDRRAPTYDLGWRGRLHSEIVGHTASLVTGDAPPSLALDVGCGTGQLLARLGELMPEAALYGVDAAPAMAQAANERGVRVAVAGAEALPFPDGAFDLVVTSTSFDHWADQLAGLRECRRVLTRGGRLLLVDQFWPPLVARWLRDSRRRARTTVRAGRLLGQAGFGSIHWHEIYATVIKGATATAV